MTRRALCALMLLVVALSPPGAAARQAAPGGFSPFGVVDPERYRFDLARNFFPSPEAERAARPRVLEREAELEAMGDAIAASGQSLLRAFELSDAVEREYRKHDLYLFLRYATNTTLDEPMRDAAELRAAVRKGRRLLRRAILAVDDEALRLLLAETPKLAEFRPAIDEIRRHRAHTLPPREEEIVGATADLTGGDFYFEAVQRIDFGKVRSGSRELDVLGQQGEISNDPDPAVREEGRRRLFAGYASKRDLFAFGLLQMIRARNAVARLRGFKDLREEAFFGNALTPEEVDATMKRLAERAELHKAYERKFRGAPGGPGGRAARFTVPEATAAIERALAPLGEDYSRELAALLDPANGRIDIAPGPNRLPMQGTASVYPAGPSVFYARGYEGFYLDVMLLAHEAGHAVQASLMRAAGVRMAYAAGPAYFTESFGRFNELVVADALARGARTPEERAYFERMLLERMLVVFGAASEAAVELEIHEAVARGEARTADDLDEAARRAGSRFSARFEVEPERKGVWMLIESMYGEPLHSVADPYAGLLALKYFSMYRRDPAGFGRRYVALLRNGYTDEPDALLKRFLGFGLRDPNLVDDALSAVR
jgi:oligoendopeptidase F